MTDRLAAVALRLLAPRARAFGIPDNTDDDSIQNIDTNNLPDGAMCWALNVNTLYRFNKTLTLVSGITIQPISGPGTWVPVFGQGTTLIQSGEAICVSGGTVTPGGASDWVDLTGLGGPGTFQGNSGATFSLNSTTGALTYGGESGKWYLVSVNATMAIDADATDTLEIVIDLNGGLLPNSSSPHSAGSTCVGTTARFQSLAASYFVQLTNGDVLTPLVRNISGTDNIRVTYLQVHVTPAQ